MNKKQKLSLTNTNRMESLIEEAQKELNLIEPKIERLKKSILKLKELQEKRQKLKALILNLQSILNTPRDFSVNSNNALSSLFESDVNNYHATKISVDTLSGRKVFIPDAAISNAQNYLRTQNNINYEIYKAVVENLGSATSEEIRHYLVKNNIQQPKNGKSFENVPLKEISSRVNYLVRRGLLISYAPGAYSTVFGWEDID